MNFTFENINNSVFLIYELQNSDEVDSMSMGMLSNNKIQGIAPIIYNQNDDKKYIKYNITGKTSCDKFFSREVKKRHLLEVFSSIIKAYEAAEEYMLQESSFILDLQYIFVDVSTGSAEMICLPLIKNEPTQVDLTTFFKKILFCTKFDSTENCNYVAQLLNYLNGAETFLISKFKAEIDKLLDESNPIRELPPDLDPPRPIPRPIPRPVAEPLPPVIKQDGSQTDSGQPRPDSPLGSNLGTVPKTSGQSKTETEIKKDEVAQTEKKMSMFNLLCHYNKENVAIYKAQKNGKKDKVKKSNDKTKAADTDFRIPTESGYGQTPHQKSQNGHAGSMTQPKNGNTMSGQNQGIPNSVGNQTPKNFGETTVLEGGMAIGETTVLSPQNESVYVTPYLIRTKNDDKIIINKSSFRIGKEKSYVDYWVSDNTAVSRNHAEIITKDHGYYIVDVNSKNHIYVNGNIIECNKEVQINNNDKIKLGNEEFTFYTI